MGFEERVPQEPSLPEMPLKEFQDQQEMADAIPVLRVGNPIIYKPRDLQGDLLSRLRDGLRAHLRAMEVDPNPSFTILYGTRRCGKTSLMHSLQALAQVPAFYYNAQGLYSDGDQVESFSKSFHHRIKKKNLDRDLKVVLLDELNAVEDSDAREKIMENLIGRNYAVFLGINFPDTHIVDEVDIFRRSKNIPDKNFQRTNVVSEEPEWLKASRIDDWLITKFHQGGLSVAIDSRFSSYIGMLTGYRPYEVSYVLNELFEWLKKILH